MVNTQLRYLYYNNLKIQDKTNERDHFWVDTLLVEADRKSEWVLRVVIYPTPLRAEGQLIGYLRGGGNDSSKFNFIELRIRTEFKFSLASGPRKPDPNAILEKPDPDVTFKKNPNQNTDLTHNKSRSGFLFFKDQILKKNYIRQNPDLQGVLEKICK